MSPLTRVIALGAVSVLATTLAGNAALAQQQTLRMAHWLPPVHHMTDTLGRWIDSVSAASGGNLVIKLDKSALAKPPGQYDLVKSGVRDIAWGVAGYTPGRMPLIRAAEVPFATPSSAYGSPALQAWYTKNGLDKREFNDTKLITTYVHGPGLLHSKKPITTLEQLKGVKLRVGGGGVAIAKGLGAVAVAMSATKANESLRRGTTDGTMFPWESIKGFRLVKLVRNHLEIPNGLYTTSFWMTMNSKAWDKLSAANKAALTKAGGVAGARLIGEGWDAADKAAKALAIASGNTITTIAPAELARWAARLQFMNDDWIAKANAQGLNGKALLDELMAMMKAPTN
jgi:TRAP-type transport system periplasmic protein